MNTGATVIRIPGAACTCSERNAGRHAGDETATFSFNLAPSASVLTVTNSDGSVARHVTIEQGAVAEPPAIAPNVERQPDSHRPDRNRHRRQRAGVAFSTR